MTTQQIDTLRAAVRVKLGLHCDPAAVNDLVRGLPQRHAVEFSLTQTADFILRGFALGQTETVLLERTPPRPDRPASSHDKLRDDSP